MGTLLEAQLSNFSAGTPLPGHLRPRVNQQKVIPILPQDGPEASGKAASEPGPQS